MHIETKKKLRRSERPDFCGRVPIVSAARTLVDFVTLLLCRCATGCDKTYWHGCGSKVSVMLRRSWYAGLQLEVAQRILTAARKVVFHHSPTLVLRRIAAGRTLRCKTRCTGLKNKNALQKLQKWQLGGSSEQK